MVTCNMGSSPVGNSFTWETAINFLLVVTRKGVFQDEKLYPDCVGLVEWTCDASHWFLLSTAKLLKEALW